MHMVPPMVKYICTTVSTEHEWESELLLKLDTAQVTFSTY